MLTWLLALGTIRYDKLNINLNLELWDGIFSKGLNNEFETAVVKKVTTERQLYVVTGSAGVAGDTVFITSARMQTQPLRLHPILSTCELFSKL